MTQGIKSLIYTLERLGEEREALVAERGQVVSEMNALKSAAEMPADLRQRLSNIAMLFGDTLDDSEATGVVLEPQPVSFESGGQKIDGVRDEPESKEAGPSEGENPTENETDIFSVSDPISSADTEGELIVVEEEFPEDGNDWFTYDGNEGDEESDDDWFTSDDDWLDASEVIEEAPSVEEPSSLDASEVIEEAPSVEEPSSPPIEPDKYDMGDDDWFDIVDEIIEEAVQPATSVVSGEEESSVEALEDDAQDETPIVSGQSSDKDDEGEGDWFAAFEAFKGESGDEEEAVESASAATNDEDDSESWLESFAS